VDILHGVPVADPYRWLEDGTSEETRQWVEGQNAFTRAVLGGLPQTEAIRARLDELFTVGAVGTPVLRSARAFYQRRDGRADQPVLVMRDGPNGEERPVVDPNALSAAGVVALDWWYPSRDGRLVAYGLSEGGTELSTLRVLNVETGEHLAGDVIPYTRVASVAWLPDSSGFYYTRFPEPGTVPPGQELYHRHVFFHRLGQDWHADEEIFGSGRAAEDSPSVNLSDGGRWLVVEVRQGWSRSEVYLLDRAHPERGLRPIFAGPDAIATTEFAGERLFVLTNDGAPNYALYEVDIERPEREAWRLVLPQRADRVLNAVAAVARRLVTHEMENASSRVWLYTLEGDPQTEVRLPSIGT